MLVQYDFTLKVKIIGLEIIFAFEGIIPHKKNMSYDSKAEQIALMIVWMNALTSDYLRCHVANGTTFPEFTLLMGLIPNQRQSKVNEVAVELVVYYNILRLYVSVENVVGMEEAESGEDASKYLLYCLVTAVFILPEVFR